MPKSSRNTNPAPRQPHMTSLSIAFPMNFESANPESNDPRRASAKQNNTHRPPHQHDAGK